MYDGAIRPGAGRAPEPRRDITGFGSWPGTIDREGRVYEVILGRMGSMVARDSRGLLWAGITDRYRLHQIDFEGDTLRIVDLEHDPVRVSAAEREAALELFSGSGDGIDQSRIPSVKPTFDRIHVDDRDHL